MSKSKPAKKPGGTAPPIDLASFLPYQISVLADQIARRTSAIAKSQPGLNLSRWRVMAAVAEQPGRTAGEVVACTPMDKGLVSRAVKHLLQLQLMERRASADDGRLGHLHLTPRGNLIYAGLAARIRPLETALVKKLSATDRKKISSLVSQMLGGLNQSDGKPE